MSVFCASTNELPASLDMAEEEAKEIPLSDEEMRKLLKPSPTFPDVLKILQASYANCPTSSCRVLEQLDSYDDCNFKVEIDKKFFLLKVHNGVESRDFLKVYEASGKDYHRKGYASSVIHFQNAIIQALTQNDISTSAVIPPTKNNNDSSKPSPVLVETLPVKSEKHSPTPLVVKLMEWLPGRPMSSVKLLPLEALADAGRVLGRVDAALDTLLPDSPLDQLRKAEMQQFRRSSLSLWKSTLEMDDNSAAATQKPDASILAAARRFHQWDGRHTGELRKFTHCISDEKRRRLVESVIDSFCEKLQAATFRRGICHGDFNDANIMVDNDFAVSGVLDFGDSVESWRVLDVSVAMAYAMLSSYGKENRSISAAAALLRGYNAVYPLTDTERSHLVLLIACRLSCSVTLGAFSLQQNPANKYLLLHAEPAWKALEMLWGYDAAERKAMTAAVDRVFRQACLHNDATGKIVTCYDLVLPDPSVADLLQSVRVLSTYDDLPSDSSNDASDSFVTPKKRKIDSSVDSQDSKLTVITFVTGNAKKLEEVKRIFGMDDESSTLPFRLSSVKIDLPELQGDALDVAREKAILAAEEVGGAVIVEDTSLCFNALNGMPGVFIKWFLEYCGHDGLNKLLAGYSDKSAFAQTVVVFLAGPAQAPVLFVGKTTGKIVMPRGNLDFGWDPIFEPDEGSGKTYAEMLKEEKDAISHRSRAFQQLSDYLHTLEFGALSKHD